MTGKLARSKSGHDKDRVYVIVREEEGCFLLADGKYRPLAHPKKKNRKHIQPIAHLPAAVQEVLDKEPMTDLLISRAIKLYENEIRRNLHVES